MWNNSSLTGWTVRLPHDDTVSKNPDFEMDLLNFLDLRCGTLKEVGAEAYFCDPRDKLPT
jgi:hypothetical protein